MADEVLIRYKADVSDFIKATDDATNKAKGLGNAGAEAGKKTEEGAKSAGKAIDGQSQVITGINQQFKRLGQAVIAAFAVERIIAFGRSSIMAFDEAAKGEAKLLNALKGRQDIQERLIKQAKQIQATTTISDDAIVSQQAYLAAQGLTEEQIKKTIQAAVQLSAVTGQDLQNTTQQLAGTYEGMTGRLARFDDRIKSLSKEQLANGAVVDILNEKYKGFAETAATSGAGSLEQLSNKFNDVQEIIGKFLFTLADPFISFFNDVLSAIIPANDELDEFGEKTKKLSQTDADALIRASRIFAARQKEIALVGILTEADGKRIEAQIDAQIAAEKASTEEKRAQELSIRNVFTLKELIKAQTEIIEAQGTSLQDVNAALKERKILQEELNKLLGEEKKEGDDEQKKAFIEENKLAREQFLEQLKIVEQGNRTAVELENFRFNERLKAAGLFNANREDLSGDSLTALQLLEQEHQENLLKIQKDGEDKRLAEEKTFQDNIEAASKKEADDKKKLEDEEEKARKERSKRIKETTDIAISEIKKQQEAKIKSIESETAAQEKNIDKQQDLAARGLANTLAFEEKRKAELQRQRQLEQERLERIKKLEIFFNAVAKFSETEKNPAVAIGKALAQVAAAEAASAIFAEEGGVIGETAVTLSSGRKHKGGGDVLLHAQTGEGVMSRDRVAKLGGARGWENLEQAIDLNMFKMPTAASVIAIPATDKTTGELLNEIKQLNKRMAAIPSIHTGIDKLDNIVETYVQNGMKEITVKKRRKF